MGYKMVASFHIFYIFISHSHQAAQESPIGHPPPIMLSVSLLSTLLLSTCVLAAPIEKRTPPGIPTTAAAKTALAGLTVAAQGPQVSFPSRMMLHCTPAPGALISAVPFVSPRKLICLHRLGTHATSFLLGSPSQALATLERLS